MLLNDGKTALGYIAGYVVKRYLHEFMEYADCTAELKQEWLNNIKR